MTSPLPVTGSGNQVSIENWSKKKKIKYLFCLSHKTWTSGHTISGERIFFLIEVVQTKKGWDKGQDYMITIFVTRGWMDLSSNRRSMAVDVLI